MPTERSEPPPPEQPEAAPAAAAAAPAPAGEEAPASPRAREFAAPVFLNVERANGCRFMHGLAATPAGPFTQNVVLKFARSQEPHPVYGVAVANGPALHVMDLRVDLADDVPVLQLRDALPESQVLGVSGVGPWLDKSRFTRAEVPFGVQLPLYLQGQGKLCHVVAEREPVTLPPPGAAAQQQQAPGGGGQVQPRPRGRLHSFLRSFSARRVFFVSLVLFGTAVAYYAYRAYLARRQALLQDQDEQRHLAAANITVVGRAPSRAKAPPPPAPPSSSSSSSGGEDSEDEEEERSDEDDARRRKRARVEKRRRRHRGSRRHRRQQRVRSRDAAEEEEDDIPDQL